MGQAIGDTLPNAIGVAISPVPIVAVILMLFTKRARSNSVAFVAGWVLGLAVVGAVILLIAAAGDLDSSTGDAGTTAGVIKLALGLLLLWLAVRSWLGRPKGGEEPETPKWMAAIDGFTALKSFGLAAVLSGVNPKNLALTFAAAVSIATAGLTAGEQVVVLVIFIVIASVTVVAPVLGYLIAGRSADEPLDRAKAWLIANNATIMAVLLLVIGVKLIGDAIGLLSS